MNYLAYVYKMHQSSERVEFKMATGCNLLSLSASRFEKQSFVNFGLLRQQLKRFLTSHVISSILTLPLHEFWSQQSAIIC